MARFYAKFDSGSAGWEPDLDISSSVIPGYQFSRYAFHNRLYVSAGSSSGALLRDGLISSRSILSTDVYAELDSANQNGSIGTYFPPDLFNTTNNLLFTASAYTSSVQGIIIPPASSGSLGYLIRPTGSVTSSQITLVGPTNPLDSASFAANSYRSASSAITTVLSTINGIAAGGPYARIGNNQSRTLHSLWYDKDLTLFGWDDFTPGTPNLTNFYSVTFEQCSGALPDPVFYDFVPRVTYGKQFNNDFNTDGARVRFQLSWSFAGQIGNPTPMLDTGIINITGSGTSGNSYYYNPAPGGLSMGDIGGTTVNYTVHATASFYDATITSSRGTLSYQSYSNSFSCP